ncbi:MAG: hypothetical protein V8S97_02720 [Oscillospiraceae bacterium]
MEGRLDQLYRLKKKYGPTVEEMLEYQARCRRELDQIQDAGDTLLHLEKQLKKAEKAARQAAESLSQARHEAAGRLEEQILTELRQLDMGKIRFAICFTEQALAENGMDAVRFLISANVGRSAPHPQNRLGGRALPHHAGHQKHPRREGSNRHPDF